MWWCRSRDNKIDIYIICSASHNRLTWGDDTIVYRHGNRTGTSVGATVSSKSDDRSAKHLRAPLTA